MKAKIHPKYHSDLKIVCSCGNIIIAGSTKENVHTEVCSACHPFYTGHQKLLDTAGRVDKFLARVKKAQAIKEKEVKKIDKKLDTIFNEPEVAEETPKAASKQTKMLNFDYEEPTTTPEEAPAEEVETSSETKKTAKKAADKPAKTAAKKTAAKTVTKKKK
ncbi:MAG TPA: 50S ribosomal protein L31 [Candidatus Gracilibacteria bacterium]|nr:50S ribosomal protein L31 [Candidatus Gracilibacteria bacterium]HRY90951.1 50S ribosomal protein L31 [Candidatus Gracilibacteria bacterium]